MKKAALMSGIMLLLSVPPYADARDGRPQPAGYFFEQELIAEVRDQCAGLRAFGTTEMRLSFLLGQCDAALNNHGKAGALSRAVPRGEPYRSAAGELVNRPDRLEAGQSAVLHSLAQARTSSETSMLHAPGFRKKTAQGRARVGQRAKDVKEAGKPYERAAGNLRHMIRRNDRIEKDEDRRETMERRGYRIY
jgi:hypothetical protein